MKNVYKMMLVLLILVLASMACMNSTPTPNVVYVEITETSTNTPVPPTATATQEPTPTNTPEPTPTDIPCVHTLESIEDEFGFDFEKTDDPESYYEYNGGFWLGNVGVLFRANVNSYGCVTETGIVLAMDTSDDIQKENVENGLGYMGAYARYIDPQNAEDILEGIPDMLTSGHCDYGESNSFSNERPDGTLYEFDCITDGSSIFWGLHIELNKESINL